MIGKTVQDVMLPEPLAIEADMSIESAAQLMCMCDTPDVDVTDNGTLCGLLTHRDISVLSSATGRLPAVTRAGECCEPDPASVAVGNTADHGIELMHRHRLGRLPVVHDGRPVGVVWVSDLIPATSPHPR